MFPLSGWCTLQCSLLLIDDDSPASSTSYCSPPPISSPLSSKTDPPSTSQVGQPQTNHDHLALASCGIGMRHHVSDLEFFKF